VIDASDTPGAEDACGPDEVLHALEVESATKTMADDHRMT